MSSQSFNVDQLVAQSDEGLREFLRRPGSTSTRNPNASRVGLVGCATAQVPGSVLYSRGHHRRPAVAPVGHAGWQLGRVSDRRPSARRPMPW